MDSPLSCLNPFLCLVFTLSPYLCSDDGGEMKLWYHYGCMFETFQKARATTKKIETPADLEGFPDLRDEEKQEIKKLIDGKRLISHFVIT